MADEYQWLDQDAAERLLRGEPVDAVDDHARAEAMRLAQALAAARPPHPAPTAPAELPGEAAALAAFRKVRAERGLAAAPSVFGTAELGAVRIGRSPATRRWGRSLRYGLAAAVAAVAVGGVAVASGTGLLPFTADRPAPAGSVSAVDTPEPIASDDSAERPDVPDASGSPEPGATTGTPSAPPTAEGATPGASTSTPAPPATAGNGGTGGEGGRGEATPEPGTSTGGPSEKDAEFGAKIVNACKEYRAGRLDDAAKKRLEKSARGGETVRRFCDRVLGGDSAGGEGDDDPSGEGERAGSAERTDDWGGGGNTRTSDSGTGHAKGSAPSLDRAPVRIDLRAPVPARTGAPRPVTDVPDRTGNLVPALAGDLVTNQV
ncbi:hypothetical protein ACFUJR_05395 [Streptomyces sp. NPDC057271]|uniref:hypothetical protein n=1 Tax=unclassified Streptomyces TaxID=2593676 RepID=UPI00362F4108